MKTTTRYPLLLTLIATLMLSGCEKGEDKEQQTEAVKSVEIVQQSGDGEAAEMVLKLNDDQETTIKYGAVDNLAGFGLPIYPHIEKVEGGVSITGDGNGAEEGMQTALLFTGDSYEKVVEFYKKQLQDQSPQTMEMNMPEGQMTMFMLEEGDSSKTIQITRNKEKNGVFIQMMKTIK